MTPASGAPDQVAGQSGSSAAWVPEMRWRQIFPGNERQLGVLRRWLESLLPECAARDDVAHVATELGTNAVRHTASGRGGWFAVEITWHPSAVRVAVADCGAPDGPQVIDDPNGEHGRGLLVVRGLSVRTGVCGDHRGRLVWADIPWDTGDAEPASPQNRYEEAIRDGQADLASSFAGVPAWFGRSTLQWWALASGQLVAAPSAQELASLLGRVLDHPPPWPPAARDTACEYTKTARAASRDQQPGTVTPQFPADRAPLPRDGRDGTRQAAQGGPRTLTGGRRPGAGARRTAMPGGLGLPAAASSGW